MYKKETAPLSKPALRLSGNPTLGEIGQMFSDAMKQSGIKLSMCWPNTDNTEEFLLGVMFEVGAKEASWEFFDCADRRRAPLWTYTTSDILLVFNLIASSGSSVEALKGNNERKKREPENFVGLYDIPDAYYCSALDLMAYEQHKVASIVSTKPSIAAADCVLKGNLAEIDLCNLLQSVAKAKLTGRLRIDTPAGEGEIYFELGVPVHSVKGSLKGDESILSMMIYRQGSFSFKSNVHADKRSVKAKLETILIKGAMLRDKLQYLLNAGLNPESVVIKKNPDLAEAEFERVAAVAASGSYMSFSVSLQKEFYVAIDGRSTVLQVAERLRLVESQWIPLLCRMIKCGFVEFLNQSNGRRLPLERKALDRHAIQSVMMSLRRPESGMYTYPAFLYFLEQEYFKHYRSRKPLSLVIIESRVSGGFLEQRSPLPALALGEFVRRISSLKRDADMLTHYDIFDAAVILPDTNHQGAVSFMNRLANALKEPLTPDAAHQYSFSIGAATIPDEVADLELLIGAAEAAKSAAQRTADGIMTYSDIFPQRRNS